jgi:hypothetical protein
MQNLSGIAWRIVCFIGVSTAATMGQTPTFSLELAEINSIPICGGGVSQMTVAPRDVLTAKVFLRDWSPNGEELRAYQAEVEHLSFTSGTAGSIKPVAYEQTTLLGYHNLRNAFIDQTDPGLAHAGEQIIAFGDTDSVVPGYRWMSVVFRDGGPICRQDGIKHYTGTLKLVVSKDAKGTFTLELVPGKERSGLRTPSGQAIEPVNVESLTLVISDGPRPVWISSSNPPAGSNDARAASSATGGQCGGWDEIELVFSAEPPALSAGDFTVEDGTASPPKITKVKADGQNAKLLLSRAITHGAWTTITHTATGTGTRIGRFPGDVNGDGVADARDLPLLISGLDGVVPLQPYRTDLDCNGSSGVSDMLWFIALLNQG